MQLARFLCFFLSHAACVALTQAGGFDEQFEAVPSSQSVLVVGDQPEPVPDENAVVDPFGTPPDATPLDPAGVVESVEAPAPASEGDFSVSSITDLDVACEGGSACQCSRCALRAHGGLLGRAWDRRDGFTTRLRADAILLFRGPPVGRPLFTTFDPVAVAAGPTVLNANQLGSSPIAAPRIAVERADACGRGVEGVFMYAGNFYAQRALPFVSQGYALAPPGIYGNTWGVGAPPLDSAQATLLSNFYSGELNVRSPIGFGATRFLAGFRWLQWGENLSITDQFTDPVLLDTGVDLYQTRCINNLYGGQIGLDTLLWNRGDGFRVESVVKAGAYYNAAAQASAYDYALSTGFGFSRAVAVSGAGSCSFVGEVGLTAVVPLRHNLDFRCGYFGLWLDSIAQPINQLSGQTLTQIDEPAGTLNTAGTVVLQGLSLGLEGRW